MEQEEGSWEDTEAVVRERRGEPGVPWRKGFGTEGMAADLNDVESSIQQKCPLG